MLAGEAEKRRLPRAFRRRGGGAPVLPASGDWSVTPRDSRQLVPYFAHRTILSPDLALGSCAVVSLWFRQPPACRQCTTAIVRVARAPRAPGAREAALGLRGGSLAGVSPP